MMDAIQSTPWIDKTAASRPAESLRAKATESHLPELTADEETMIQREFDPQAASVRYNRHGDTAQAQPERGQQVDWRV